MSTINIILTLGTAASLAGGILKMFQDRRRSRTEELEIKTSSGEKVRVHLTPEKAREVIANARASAEM